MDIILSSKYLSRKYINLLNVIFLTEIKKFAVVPKSLFLLFDKIYSGSRNSK